MFYILEYPSLRNRHLTKIQTDLLKQSSHTNKKSKKKANSVSQKTAESKPEEKIKDKKIKDTKNTVKLKTKNVTKKEDNPKLNSISSASNDTGLPLSSQDDNYIDNNGVEEVILDRGSEDVSEEYVASEDIKENGALSDNEFAAGGGGKRYRDGTIGAKLYEVSTLAEINGYLNLGKVRKCYTHSQEFQNYSSGLCLIKSRKIIIHLSMEAGY